MEQEFDRGFIKSPDPASSKPLCHRSQSQMVQGDGHIHIDAVAVASHVLVGLFGKAAGHHNDRGAGHPHLAIGGLSHPLTQVFDRINEIFLNLGFKIVEGPEIETSYYNFEALNMPAEHPARDSQSTLWVDYKTESGEMPMLLRTQGTAISARVIETMKPPIRTIEPARVYRREATDATHLSIYHNIDGLAVDKNITMADLKGTLYEFAHRYFGEDRKVRFRCDYFPFVEPGVEMAIDCIVCNGKGCRLCGNSGWIEILGAGMTHPDVLRRGGIDPEVYSSFAFGMGVERMPMLRYGIDDIRLFYGSDLRFLRQF
jgi:phenylalanyl-tRNA synthetase alpha chain